MYAEFIFDLVQPNNSALIVIVVGAGQRGDLPLGDVNSHHQSRHV